MNLNILNVNSVEHWNMRISLLGIFAAVLLCLFLSLLVKALESGSIGNLLTIAALMSVSIVLEFIRLNKKRLSLYQYTHS